jgi:hypothetical protein
MSQLARWLIVSGLLIAGLGVLLLWGDRIGLGRLPGDLLWKRKNTTMYFPLMTSLVVSLVLTVLLNLFLRRK